MSWLPIAIKAPWNPTGKQLRRVCELAESHDRARVYTIPPGSLLLVTQTTTGDLRWVEVIPPEPDYLIAYDTGAR